MSSNDMNNQDEMKTMFVIRHLRLALFSKLLGVSNWSDNWEDTFTASDYNEETDQELLDLLK